MDVPPNQTLYLTNVYEKMKKEEAKRCLYALFGQFGKIIDVVCMKTEKLRGQAWVVFADVTSATNAMRSMQDFPFFGKALRVQYARTKSDATAKLDGTWKKDKRTRQVTYAANGEATKSGEEGGKPQKASRTGSSAQTTVADVGEPNSVLFLENLPEATNELMLDVLFKQFPGYKEARLVPGKPGIAFVEFEADFQAGVALAGLQGFKITPQNSMHIIYSKK